MDVEHSSFQEDSGLGEDDSSSSSHPDRYDNAHISKLEVFTEDLQKAIANSFPRSKTTYSSVHVLLLRWAEDDLNVQVELTSLRNVFETQFYFATEQWDIPSRDSTRALQTKLYEFQQAHQNEDELLILYYGGHGYPDRRGRSIWAAKRQDSPTLTWSSLQHLLETAVPHVLIILDCCYAANAARDTAEGTTKELLAACGRENPTLDVGIRSFTSALIEELQAFGETQFTVAMLHQRLITMRWRLAFTPIYALLSEHGGHSIELASMPPTIQNTHLSVATGLQTNNGPNEVLSHSIQSSPSQQSCSSAMADTRVLLAVSIAHDAVHDISEWKKWLTSQAPWDVTKIEVRVEAVFESHSTMLLTSLPIAAWDLLPHRIAYRFVGFVKSEKIQVQYTEPRSGTEELKAQADRMPLKPLTLERRPTATPSSKPHPDDAHGWPPLQSVKLSRPSIQSLGSPPLTIPPPPLQSRKYPLKRSFEPLRPLQRLKSPQMSAREDIPDISRKLTAVFFLLWKKRISTKLVCSPQVLHLSRSYFRSATYLTATPPSWSKPEGWRENEETSGDRKGTLPLNDWLGSTRTNDG
ncbi:MAG: hypothetical protein Q9181_000931 [Wetmoreana brouardii]